MSQRISSFVILTLLAGLLLFVPRQAQAVHSCGGEQDTCDCGGDNFCYCCDTSGNIGGSCENCVWHAWHMACCNWRRALEWCTNANDWDNQARARNYQMGATPRANSIFVKENPMHVGWVTRSYANGSFDATEQHCGHSACNTTSHNRAAGYATSGFIYGPPAAAPVDNATFVSETYPDGTRVNRNTRFTKRWCLRNSGTSTWTRAGLFKLKYVRGQRFGAAAETLLPAATSVAPGAQYCWDVAMTAPAAAGRYVGYWRSVHNTTLFGQEVWIDITVP